MLAQLATVAFDAGLPDSRRRLREALREVRDRESRIDVLTRLAALNVLDAGDADHAELFERELAVETDPDARLAVEAASLDALMMIPGAPRRARAARGGDRPARRRPTRCSSACSSPTAPGSGSSSARPTRRRAPRWRCEALDGDLLLHEAGRRAAYHLCVRALVMTDRPEEARRAIAALRDEATARGSLRLRARRVAGTRPTSRCAAGGSPRPRTTPAWRSTSSTTASTCSPAARSWCCSARWPSAARSTRPASCCASAARRRAGARRAGRSACAMRGRACGWPRATSSAPTPRRCAAGALREQQGRPQPDAGRRGARPPRWRSPTSGAARRPPSLADAELALAERFGAPVPIAPALHARAVAEADDAARVALCERALAVVAGVPAVLERVRAAPRARAARWPTWAGASRRATRCARRWPTPTRSGAVLLAQRARRELVATGLRPRQAAIEGAAALTPRQRQICELAAAGKGNRAIAQELFLSIKTVETHLAAGYRKLGVNARADLAAPARLLTARRPPSGAAAGKRSGCPTDCQGGPAPR